MRVVTLLLLFLGAWALKKRTYVDPDKYFIYYKLFKCEPTERGRQEYLHNISCFAKSYSRNFSTLNGYGHAKKPLYPEFEGALAYKYGTIYRDIISVPRFKVCDIYELVKSNMVLRELVKQLKNVAPSLIHECPYLSVEVYNITHTAFDKTKMLPQGDYRAIVFLYDDKKDPLGKGTFVFSVRSSFKDSFG